MKTFNEVMDEAKISVELLPVITGLNPTQRFLVDAIYSKLKYLIERIEHTKLIHKGEE